MTQEKVKEEDNDADKQVFVAFARVFSGTVKKGQPLYVLGPKHDPAKALAQVTWQEENTRKKILNIT